jgi:hypothetical protein
MDLLKEEKIGELEEPLLLTLFLPLLEPPKL